MKITRTFDYELTYDDILRSYPWNLYRDVAEPESKESALMVDPIALETAVDNALTDRERDVIKMYYKDGKTYKEIAPAVGVCTERIGQIVHKAVRKLRDPSRFNNFKMCSKFETDNEIKSYIHKVNSNDPEVAKKVTGLGNYDFSVRTYNCLLRAGVKSLEDLVGWTPAKLMKIRNMGLHSYTELKDIMVQHGYNFPTSDDGDDWVDSPITSPFAEKTPSLVEQEHTA